MNDPKRVYLVILITAVLGWGFAGCESDEDSSSDDGSTTPPPNKLVDPYISKAVLYQDDNDNEKYDEGEPVSTFTTANGEFTISKTIAGKKIRIKKQGTHVGLPYDLELSKVVPEGGRVGVISPLTTLMAEYSLTAEEVAAILNQAASFSTAEALKADRWKIEAADISKDPLGGGLMEKTVEQIADNELRIIRASMATYGVLKVIKYFNVSKENIMAEAVIGGRVNRITKEFLEIISRNITKKKLENFKNHGLIRSISLLGGNQLGGVTVPKQIEFTEPKMGLVVRAAVRIMDLLTKSVIFCVNRRV